MQEVVVTRVRGHRLVIGDGTGQHAVGFGHRLQETDDVPGAAHLLGRARVLAGAQQHRVAQNLFGLPARIHVVADVRDAEGRQCMFARGEDRLLHTGRHPAVNTVADDVVELTQPGEVQARNVSTGKLDVVEASSRMRKRPCSTCTGDRSIPTARAPGWAAANGIRLPADAQPISSTRAVDTSGASNPKTHASAARCPGDDCGWAYDSYCASSYAARRSSATGPAQHAQDSGRGGTGLG
jgi:hypothetical protein